MLDESLKNAKKYVLYLLSRRDYSRYQIERKLKLKKVPQDQASQILEDLKAEGLFKENAYAKARTRQLLKKGLSNTALKSKLRFEHCIVQDTDIEEAYLEVGSSGELELQSQLKKELRKFAKKNEAIDAKAIQKISQTLQKKGHRFSDIQKNLTLVLKEEEIIL